MQKTSQRMKGIQALNNFELFETFFFAFSNFAVVSRTGVECFFWIFGGHKNPLPKKNIYCNNEKNVSSKRHVQKWLSEKTHRQSLLLNMPGCLVRCFITDYWGFGRLGGSRGPRERCEESTNPKGTDPKQNPRKTNCSKQGGDFLWIGDFGDHVLSTSCGPPHSTSKRESFGVHIS